MSDWGGEMDKLLAITRTALDTVELGLLPVRNAERSLREVSEVEESELPHAFIYNPISEETEVEFLQAEVRSTYTMELWDSADQERFSVYRDAIKDTLRADNTLTSTVLDARVASTSLIEPVDPNERRVLIVEFETLRREG